MLPQSINMLSQRLTALKLFHINYTIKPFSSAKFLGNKTYANIKWYHVHRCLYPPNLYKLDCRVLGEAEVKTLI